VLGELVELVEVCGVALRFGFILSVLVAREHVVVGGTMMTNSVMQPGVVFIEEGIVWTIFI
jgi:hypothetical protein